MRGDFGTSFSMSHVLEIALVIIGAFLITGLVISATGGIHSLMQKLCDAVPSLCGQKQDIDYEVSARSTKAVACAIGSVGLGKQWDGGSFIDCIYETPSSQTSGGGGVTGGATLINPLTTADAGKDEELSLNQLRELEPSVSCSKDSAGKLSCKVKNFVMPEEVSKWEDRIPYWGDPNYLFYWNTFPTEEDTWNFKIDWKHHAFILAISILPVGKTMAVGFKTFWTALKGPGNKLIQLKAAQVLFKQGEKGILENTLQKIIDKEVAKGFLKAEEKTLLLNAISHIGTDVSDDIARVYGEKLLSKLSKKELQQVLKDAGIRYGRKAAVSDVMRRGAVEILKRRTEKLGIKPALMMGGKFAAMETALAALADSTMRKYEPIGNAVTVKNPELGEEDRLIFELPQEMKDMAVLVKWKPKEEKAVYKNAHFVSPCYLEEFSLSKEAVVCERYIKNDEGSIVCDGAFTEGSTPDRYECGTIEWDEISSRTRSDMGDNIKDLIENDDKKLFEINDTWGEGEFNKTAAIAILGSDVRIVTPEIIKLVIEKRNEILQETGRDPFDDIMKWKLEKIYLPWLSTDYFSSLVPKEKYYLDNIEFVEGLLKRPATGYPSGTWDKPRAQEIIIGENMEDFIPGWDTYAGYTETYSSSLRCGEDCSFLLVEGNKNDVVMSSGKEYLMRMKTSSKDGVIVDVYDVDSCIEVSLLEKENFKEGVIKCDVVKDTAERIKSGNGKMGEATLGGGLIYEFEVPGIDVDIQMSRIRQYIKDVGADYYILRIVPKGDIKANDISYYNGVYVDGFLECKSEGPDDGRVCIRTLQEKFDLENNIKCESTGKDMTSDKSIILSMNCDIDLPKAFKEPFPDEKELMGVALSVNFHVYFNNSDELNHGRLMDKSYSSLTFGSIDNIFVQFGDADEDGKWDDISVERGETFLDKIKPDCLFGESKNKFKIEISDIGIVGNKNYDAYPLYMENCKMNAVVISFEGDTPDKIKTDAKNYCLRNTKGITRILNANFCGVSIANTASAIAFIASSVVADGASAVLLLTAIGTETYAGVSEEIQKIWPG